MQRDTSSQNCVFYQFLMFQKIYDALLTIAYPQICNICQRSVENSKDGIACDDCWKRTRLLQGDEVTCYKCQRLLSWESSQTKTFCHQCDDHFYDLARAAGLYERALLVSVLGLKRHPYIAPRLKTLFCEAFANSPFDCVDRIIPVPLSEKRFIERGFNQSSILARIIAKNTGKILDEQVLIRKTHSKVHRASMDRKGRELSVKNAFRIKEKGVVKNKTILLTDDVFASGATVSDCAKVLKTAGATRVYVLTMARVFNQTNL